MTTPSAWRFQWPDGTWIRWNPDTEEWEKEPASPDEAPVPVLDAPPPPAPAAEAADELPTDEPADEPAPEDDSDPFSDEDDEGSRTRARPAEEVFAGRARDERPGRSLLPTILGGAAIGLVVGIVVTLLLR